MIEQDNRTLTARLDLLRQWRDATSFDGAELILDRELISYMLDLIDSSPTYTAITSPKERAELQDLVLGVFQSANKIAGLLGNTLEDLKQAEAKLKVES